jgi:membrane protease YdiL (CAAX protease family)
MPGTGKSAHDAPRELSDMIVASTAQYRPATWGGIVLAFLAWAGSGALAQGSSTVRGAFRWVAAATGGWLNPTLLTNAAVLLAVVGAIVGLGRLRLRDLGLAREGLVPGMAGAVALWAAWQGSLLVSGLVETGSIGIGPRWTNFDAPVAIGMLAAMVFVGLNEEVWFRGFLLVQVQQRMVTGLRVRAGLGFAVALVATSILFGAVHLWGSSDGSPVRALAFHGVNGILFGMLYLLSGNLWFVAAVHGLGNWGLGMPLFQSAAEPAHLLMAVKVALIGSWAAYRRRARRGDETTQPDQEQKRCSTSFP